MSLIKRKSNFYLSYLKNWNDNSICAIRQSGMIFVCCCDIVSVKVGVGGGGVKLKGIKNIILTKEKSKATKKPIKRLHKSLWESMG